MAKIKKRIGETFSLKTGELVCIIEYIDESNCNILLPDGNVIKNRSYNKIKKGLVKNVFAKTVYSVGFIGCGDYIPGAKNHNKSMKTWRSMIARCYDEKELKKHPTYLGCSVVNEWHNYQNFAKWFEKNYIKGWQLDKDIIVVGNKIYSPETCCFVPSSINQIFKSNKKTSIKGIPVGVTKHKNKYRVFISLDGELNYFGTFKCVFEAFSVYKKEKENYVKRIAKKWKNKINPKVYESLINYKVQ